MPAASTTCCFHGSELTGKSPRPRERDRDRGRPGRRRRRPRTGTFVCWGSPVSRSGWAGRISLVTAGVAGEEAQGRWEPGKRKKIAIICKSNKLHQRAKSGWGCGCVQTNTAGARSPGAQPRREPLQRAAGRSGPRPVPLERWAARRGNTNFILGET